MGKRRWLGISVMAISALISGVSLRAIAQPSTDNFAQADTNSVGDLTSLAGVRSRLTNLESLPLFLPPSRGTLASADDQLSSTQLSQPSFAWIRDQVALRYNSTTLTPELVAQWQAYITNDGFQYVDVVVNESQWEQLNYLRRYGFVVQFGTVAQSYGYQLRVFHTGDAANRNDGISLAAQNSSVVSRSIRLRGTYFCVPSVEQLPTCAAFVAP